MKKILLSFIGFACIILICRHVVSDIKQGQRITVLENLLDNMQYKLDSLIFSADDFRDSVSFGNRERIRSAKKYYSRNPNVARENSLSESREEGKFSNPMLLDLNTIDSATLTRIPGIAEKTASIIIKYRDQLGGFYNPYQLSEKLTWKNAEERMNEWCTLWFTADTRHIRKLNVNMADFKKLLKHPYLSYEQTKALVNYRDKHRYIEGIAVLGMLEQFSEDDIARLEYYLDFSH